jgi:hypothetical protein
MEGDTMSEANDDGGIDPETVKAVEALWHRHENPTPVENVHAVLAMLQSIVAGHMGVNEVYFVRFLAKALLDAAGKPESAQTRRDEVYRASGLSGEHNRDVDADDGLVLLDGFDGATPAALIAYARAEGMLPDMDDKVARQKLARIKARRSKPQK